MEWIMTPYRKLYPAIAGRATRKEFWLFTLYVVLVSAAFAALFMGTAASVFMSTTVGTPPPVGAIIFLFVLMLPFGLWAYLTFPALIALQCRRLHDQDRSAWFMLITIIPYLGALIMLIFMCIGGTSGPNRFGADPREASNVDVFD